MPSTLHNPPLIAANTTRANAHEVLEKVVLYMIGEGSVKEGKKEIADRAGISYRHFLDVLKGHYPNRAIDILRMLGYEVFESIEVQSDQLEEPFANE